MYNMSIFDGIIRIFAGCIIGGICGAYGLWVGAIIVPYLITTAMGGYCLVYQLFGWSTLEDPETNAHEIHQPSAKSSKMNTISSQKAA